MPWHSRKELQRRYQLEKQTTSTYIAMVFIGMYEYDYRVSRYKSQEWYGNRAVNEVILFCVHMETHQYHCELSLKFPTPIWSKAISISLLRLDILVKFNVKASHAGAPSTCDCVVSPLTTGFDNQGAARITCTIFLQPPISLPNYMHNAFPCSISVPLEWENYKTAWHPMPFQSIIKLTWLHCCCNFAVFFSMYQ